MALPCSVLRLSHTLFTLIGTERGANEAGTSMMRGWRLRRAKREWKLDLDSSGGTNLMMMLLHSYWICLKSKFLPTDSPYRLKTCFGWCRFDVSGLFFIPIFFATLSPLPFCPPVCDPEIDLGLSYWKMSQLLNRISRREEGSQMLMELRVRTEEDIGIMSAVMFLIFFFTLEWKKNALWLLKLPEKEAKQEGHDLIVFRLHLQPFPCS